MTMLAFTVFGIAQPQGSSRAFIPRGWKRPIITSDNPKNKGWRELVAHAASVAVAAQRFTLLDEPAVLEVRFFLPRPKAIKDKTLPHTKKPDLDKLVRSCKGELYR